MFRLDVRSTLMFLFCSSVWGTSYLAYRAQLHWAPAHQSLLYRLLMAAIIMWVWNFLSRERFALSVRDHLSLAFFGIFNFFLSYYLLYRATALLPSGIVVLIFSGKSLVTPVLLALLLGHPLRPSVVSGGTLGLLGIFSLVFFGPSGLADSTPQISYSGLGLSMAGMSAAAIGDVFSARNAKARIDPVTANSWGLLYAAVAVLSFSLSASEKIAIPPSVPYWMSILWLALAASVLAWRFYLVLLSRVGADVASSVVLLLPVFGLIASLLFEGVDFSAEICFSLTLVMAGTSFPTLCSIVRNAYLADDLTRDTV